MKKMSELDTVIIGIEGNGGKLVKYDTFDICFNIIENSYIDNDERLRITRDLLKNRFGLTLKIKKIKKNG